MLPDWGQNAIIYCVNLLTFIPHTLWFFVRVEHCHRFNAVIKHYPILEHGRGLATRRDARFDEVRTIFVVKSFTW